MCVCVIPSTTKCLRLRPHGDNSQGSRMGIARNSRPLTLPIVNLWRFWFLECLVVYCNVPPPISMDHPELGKLFLKHTNVLDRKFPMRNV